MPAKKTNNDYINQMYDASLAGDKASITAKKEQSITDLDRQQDKVNKQADQQLTQAAVSSAQAIRNYNESQNAYGMTSGVRARARVAQENAAADQLAGIRAAKLETDADIQAQRRAVESSYLAAIANAQAQNDYARANALYAELKDQQALEYAKQEGAANLMASAAKDYSLLGQLYGLTPEQLEKLK